MWMETAIDAWGEPMLLLAAGIATGLVFGAAAQHSRFCLRAATVELASGKMSDRMGVWLLTFAFAVLGTQGAIALGWLDVSGARMLASTGSMSGAILGGAMFGVGMILSRGCASRLLVLSGTGNLRALVTGLVLTLVAQASYKGVLAPLREALAGLWTVPGGASRSMLEMVGAGHLHALALGVGLAAIGIVLCRLNKVRASEILAASLVGLAVALGWVLTGWVVAHSFEPLAPSSVTFTGPATDTLMALVNERSLTASFGLGLVPAVFFGSMAMAMLTGQFRIQRFSAETGMERYFIGAGLMGFGAMLAGGCAVGAGVSGGAVFAITAWVALLSMWLSAMATYAISEGVLADGRGAARTVT